LAKLRDKCCVALNPLHRHHGHKRKAHQQVIAVTTSTPPVKAMGSVRFGSRTSPAILPASHQPPKQKKALIAAPAIASISGSAPPRRAVRGARFDARACPDSKAHPTN